MSGYWAGNWWGAVWVEKMARLAEPSRFGEGEQCARSGRVGAIRFDGRTITAGVVEKIQRPGEKKYIVRISFDPFSREQWEQLLENVGDRRAVAASLSSGDLPLEIQTAFSKANLRFMPERYVDLHLECACPDWLKPCKHLVAVWLGFARDFDHDPFLLFQLRGLKRDDLLAMLSDRATMDPEPEPEAESADGEAWEEVVPVTIDPLPADPAAFWAERALPALPPESPGRLLLDDDFLQKLGPAPYARNWRALEGQFREVYESVYELAALCCESD